MKLRVPNKKPDVQLANRLAIIGEAPGRDDEQHGAPFVGSSGNLLSKAMSATRLMRSACFLGNISQFAMNTDFMIKSWSAWEVQDGLEQLREDIKEYDPHCVLLLGASALYAAGVKHPVTSYRGSLFECRDTESPFYGRKCIATLHPSAVMKSYKDFPLFVFDVKRAVEESLSPVLSLPQRNADIYLSADEIVRRLVCWPKGHMASIDIEGTCSSNITCMAVAQSPLESFVIDWRNMLEQDKAKVFDAVYDFLTDKEIPKIVQNALYENFVIPWMHKTPVHNIGWDTLLSGWEIYPELPKSLGVQASIWTREPYYKSERKIPDNETHLKYCAKDAMVTYEIALEHKKLLDQPAYESRRKHLEFNHQLLTPLAYCQLRGIKYDLDSATQRHHEIQVQLREYQSRIDAAVGMPLNVNSPKQMVHCLYTRMGFEPQYAMEKGRKTTKKTADVNALLTLLIKYDSDLVYNVLKWRSLQEDCKQLRATVDPDGRIRTSYVLPGTDTGRLSSSGSTTGSGYNLQTTRKYNRRYFVADPGKYIAQIDLSGADGWTVAAHSANLHDGKMLDDYLAGVKPAKVIAVMYLTGRTDMAQMRPAEVLSAIKGVEIPEWLYAACKAVQHGTNYNMAERTMSTNILKQSWKHMGEPVSVPPTECRKLQQLYILRYPGVAKWQNWVKLQLESVGRLSCASGHVRQFFGRTTDNATYQSALSHEPQANTTYATNLALHNLWHDATNRNPDGSLVIEPLHQVHDALICQFPIDQTDSCITKIKSYFNNTLTIANRSIVIPFEGEYGLYWGDKSGGIITP
jgi:uracil-DNA glycosylase family 4